MIRKLRLNRETVRLLTHTALVRVRGGLVACSATCGVCDPPLSQPQSCQGCTND